MKMTYRDEDIADRLAENAIATVAEYMADYIREAIRDNVESDTQDQIVDDVKADLLDDIRRTINSIADVAGRDQERARRVWRLNAARER